MTNQPNDKVLSETGKLVYLVAIEQRPQLIVLILAIFFSQTLIITSGLSPGIKVFLSLFSLVLCLWLAIFIIPKQLRSVESIQNLLREEQKLNQELESCKATLKDQISEIQKRLSDSITDARSCLEDIDSKVNATEENTKEEHTKSHLTDIHHYIAVKKRELNSALIRVSNGSQVIETKKAAGIELASDFQNIMDERSKDSSQVSKKNI